VSAKNAGVSGNLNFGTTILEKLKEACSGKTMAGLFLVGFQRRRRMAVRWLMVGNPGPRARAPILA
jgi:hypothetical protein